MTKQEFTVRTGINPTDEEFNRIHELYMAVGDDMDKEQFCTAYKSCKDLTLANAIFNNLSSRIKKLEEERDEIEHDFEDLHEKALHAANTLVDVSSVVGRESTKELLNNAAVSLIGQFNVWMLKLNADYYMSEDEKIRFHDEIAELRGQIAEYKFSGKIEKYDRENENK